MFFFFAFNLASIHIGSLLQITEQFWRRKRLFYPSFVGEKRGDIFQQLQKIKYIAAAEFEKLRCDTRTRSSSAV